MADTPCACGCGSRVKSGNRYLHGHNARKPLDESRWSVEERGYGTPCWVWRGEVLNTGYGRIRRHDGGGTELAHRIVYERCSGPIPKGTTLHHHCRVKACVNPEHLQAMTHRDNCRLDPGGRPREISESHVKLMREFEDMGIARRHIAAMLGCSRASVTRYLGARM